MIERINLLNPMALRSHNLDCQNIEITKVIISNNDPTLEIRFVFKKEDFSLYIDISFIGVDELLIKNISFSNIIESYFIEKNIFSIKTKLDGLIEFKYEWGNIESMKNIKEGEF
ncbi:hypothetical protein BFR75_16960 [Acinetobacter pittii]|jgi:hypothetical protein|uniref:hypothetical protein n=1 Tax=Acinetobacter TaxID=469 RepID=UPI00083835B4|nr:MULTISPECIES: hypothetical protein [Acinetobacter]MDS7958788.1 hypothetical protein [Acinetobacter sp. V104_13]MDS7982917.1 hypothetical protein [Acinetobacter sp. V104_3]OCY28428.1 hypothetical protein BFR75_16960 [Acinetobacter pittii]